MGGEDVQVRPHAHQRCAQLVRGGGGEGAGGVERLRRPGGLLLVPGQQLADGGGQFVHLGDVHRRGGEGGRARPRVEFGGSAAQPPYGGGGASGQPVREQPGDRRRQQGDQQDPAAHGDDLRVSGRGRGEQPERARRRPGHRDGQHPPGVSLGPDGDGAGRGPLGQLYRVGGLRSALQDDRSVRGPYPDPGVEDIAEDLAMLVLLGLRPPVQVGREHRLDVREDGRGPVLQPGVLLLVQIAADQSEHQQARGEHQQGHHHGHRERDTGGELHEPLRASGTRRTKPTPRTVWIRRGRPPSSSLRRR